MTKKQHKNFNMNETTNLIFKISYIVITIFVVGFVLFICTRPFQINSYDEMKQVSYEEYKTKKAEEYYVMIYADGFEKSAWYEDIASEYADYVRTHSGVMPIYGYDFHERGNSKILTDLNISNENQTKVIRLLKISKGSVSKSYTDWDDIHNELTSAMSK